DLDPGSARHAQMLAVVRSLGDLTDPAYLPHVVDVQVGRSDRQTDPVGDHPEGVAELLELGDEVGVVGVAIGDHFQTVDLGPMLPDVLLQLAAIAQPRALEGYGREG